MQTRFRFAAVAALGVLLLVGAGCSSGTETTADEPAAPAGPAAGDTVLVVNEDGDRWWDATIEAVGEGDYTVKYTVDELVEENVPATRMALPPSGDAEVAVGDTVVAQWWDDNFYAAEVLSVDDVMAMVKGGDGEELEVELAKITKPLE